MGKSIAAFVALVVLSGLGSIPSSARADEFNGAKVAYQHIADLRSRAGESEHAFLVRIGPQLRAFSDKTGFEACGVIGSDKNGDFGVVLGSSGSRIGCVNDPARVLTGMTSTGETIHSHGRQGSFNMNHADKALSGLDPFDINLIPIHGADLFHFSPRDYAAGAGYLATPTGLEYQDGRAGSEVAVLVAHR